MFLSDLLDDCNRQIVDHHASGHFITEEATTRLIANGLTAEQAAEQLAPEDAQ